MEKRLILFLVLSSAIFVGWSYLYGRLYPASNTPSRPATTTLPGATPGSESAVPSGASPVDSLSEVVTPASPATQAQFRQIIVRTDHWKATISNQGAVITEWVMTAFVDGKPIDPPNGVALISPQLNAEIG